MTRIKFIFYFLLLIGMTSSCSGEDEKPAIEGDHIEYFGFAITDCGRNYRHQVNTFVNLIDMCPEDYSNLESRVASHTSTGNKVVIHLQGFFTEIISDFSSPSGFKYELYDDWEAVFKLWSDNNSGLSANEVAAFTIADEPAWNQMDMNDLDLIAGAVKSKFPDIPIMVIEAPDVIDNLVITDNIDWIGFDRYGTLDPLNDQEYLSRLNKIKSKRTNSNQKLVIIMESQWTNIYNLAGLKEDILIPMAESYYNLAKKEKDVIALISYLLPSGFDTPDQKGFLDLKPEVQLKIIEIGSEIINR
jgi:hypothetical protein